MALLKKSKKNISKKAYEEVACPIRGKNGKTHLPFFSIRFDDEKKAKASVCDNCAHVYLSKRWNEVSYDEFYEDEYRQKVGFNRTDDSDTFLQDTMLRGANIVSFVSGLVPQDREIVEIGCGNGGILLAFREAGYTKLLGIEPNIAFQKPYPSTA